MPQANTIVIETSTEDTDDSAAIEAADIALYGPEEDRQLDEQGNLIPLTSQHLYSFSEVQEYYILDSEARVLADSGDVVSRRYCGDNCHYSERTGEWYASEYNMPDNQESENNMLSYTTNVLSYFPGTFDTRTKNLVFGIELEMEARDDIESVLSELSAPVGNQYIVKEDGSLSNGCELVSMPMSLEAHRLHNWGSILTDSLRSVARSANTSTCGFHVHINRAALKPLTVGKMLVMVNSPDPLMTEFLELVAQRSAGHWCQKSPKKLSDGRAMHSAHYDILGLTSKGTCELRMFKGNLIPDRVYKNLEFCHALVRFCEKTSGKYVENAGVFMAWLLKNKADYPALTAYLSARKYAPWLALTRTRATDTITDSEEE